MVQTESQKAAQKRWRDKIKGTARGLEYKILCSELTKENQRQRYAVDQEYRDQQKNKGRIYVYRKKYYTDFDKDFCLSILF